MTYARRTYVPVERSRVELVALLVKYGATQHYTGEDSENREAVVGFSLGGRQVRLRIPMPDPETRSKDRYAQESRSRWRAVVLVVKAKLELISLGLSTVQHEFLADIALPNGRTVGDWFVPQLQRVYENGSMPRLLPGAKEDDDR